MRAPRLASVAILLLLLVPWATASPSPPRNLEGSFDPNSGIVSLSWLPPPNGTANFSYYIWRDGNVSLGHTTTLSAQDDPPGQVPDYGLVYLVSAAPPGNANNIGMPAVIGVPTITCEVVSVTTTWSSPFLYIHLHQECLGGLIIYDKDVTWQQP